LLATLAGPEIFIWGGGSGRKFPSWVQEQSLVRKSGAQSSAEAEAVCRHCLQILTAATIEM